MEARGGNPAAAAKRAIQSGYSATTTDWRSTLARYGLAAKGVLYGAIGLLAIQVAAGTTSHGSADQRGAVELVASQPFGQLLLGLLTLGLFCLTAWQAILAVKGDPVEGSDTIDRVKFAAKAAIYLLTAATALTILLAGWGSSGPMSESAGSESSQDETAAIVMAWPAGPWLVGLAGMLIIGLAVYQFYMHTLNMDFMYRLDRSRMSGTLASGVERAGRAGYGARAVVLLVTGLFLLIAAVRHDPREAVGLSGALAAISGQGYGQIALWGIAMGLFLYGLFCLAEARYRRAT